MVIYDESIWNQLFVWLQPDVSIELIEICTVVHYFDDGGRAKFKDMECRAYFPNKPLINVESRLHVNRVIIIIIIMWLRFNDNRFHTNAVKYNDNVVFGIAVDSTWSRLPFFLFPRCYSFSRGFVAQQRPRRPDGDERVFSGRRRVIASVASPPRAVCAPFRLHGQL